MTDMEYHLNALERRGVTAFRGDDNVIHEIRVRTIDHGNEPANDELVITLDDVRLLLRDAASKPSRDVWMSGYCYGFADANESRFGYTTNPYKDAP